MNYKVIPCRVEKAESILNQMAGQGWQLASTIVIAPRPNELSGVVNLVLERNDGRP